MSTQSHVKICRCTSCIYINSVAAGLSHQYGTTHFANKKCQIEKKYSYRWFIVLKIFTGWLPIDAK